MANKHQILVIVYKKEIINTILGIWMCNIFLAPHAQSTLLLSQRVSAVYVVAVWSLNDGGEKHSPLRDNPQPGRRAAGGCESDKE